MTWLKAFLAGFFSTLVFHQGLLAILHAAGASPRAAYSMEPHGAVRSPRGSLARVLGRSLGNRAVARHPRHQGSALYWLLALIVGAIAPSLVALFVVLPLKGQPAAGGGNPTLIVGALLLERRLGPRRRRPDASPTMAV